MTTEGPDTGGTDVTFTATGLGMESSEDLVQSDVVDTALWDESTAGSGLVTAIGATPRGVLQLSTGWTASSSAYLRTDATSTRSDASIECIVRPRFRAGDAEATASLGLYVGATTYFRVIVEMSKGAGNISVRSVVNDVTHLDVTLQATTTASLSMRILRVDSDVYVYLNDVFVTQTRWTTEAASVEIGVANDAAGRASMVLSVTEYRRNPVILFGDLVMRTVTFKGPDRVDGLTPPHDVGEVDVVASTDLGDTTLGTFTYTSSIDYARLGYAGADEMLDVSDPAVRN